MPAQEFLSFGRYTGETHANAETGRRAGDLSVQTQLGFAQPERHSKAGFDWQRDGHFNETAAHAQIRGLAPNDRLAGRMQLDRNGALHSRRAPPLNRGAEGIDRKAMRKGKIPERLLRAQIQQPYLAFARRARCRSPFHTEMHFALSVGQTDDFVHFNLRADSAQPCPALTDVQGCNILREYLAVGVRPKDAHRHFHRFPGLSALPHLDGPFGWLSYRRTGCLCWKSHVKAARLDAHQPFPAAWGNGCKPLQSEFEYSLNLRKSNQLVRHLRHSNCSVTAAGHGVSRFGSELKNTT